MCAVGDIQSVGIRRVRLVVEVGAGTRSSPVSVEIEGGYRRVASIQESDSAASLLAFVGVFIQYRIVNEAIASRVENADTPVEHAGNERAGRDPGIGLGIAIPRLHRRLAFQPIGWQLGAA